MLCISASPIISYISSSWPPWSCQILAGYLGHENSRHFLPAVASAQRAVREVAAYLLDQGHAKARCVFSTVKIGNLSSNLDPSVDSQTSGANDNFGSLPAPKLLS